MEQLLCAVYDRLAAEVHNGFIMTFKSETVALRTWDDICRQPNSAVALHIHDFELVKLASVNMETLEVKPERRIIMTGAQWAAMQPQGE